MKTSLKKLQGFAALRHDRRERNLRSFNQEDELAQANQDMQDTRDCYEKLLSAAAATTNSAYEFSESLGEMGDCLLEKTALVDDQESGKVLLMLGKVQFQLQKLLDTYRSHISQTITAPSESLLHELNIVEDMKRQCDVKREAYDDLIQKYREKGKLRGTKGECFSSHKLQAAYDEYDNGANVFVLRMKSLRQGQSRSLLTQASRHHAAQLSFFRRAVKSLEEIEPHVKLVTELQHIDYPFSGLGDDTVDEYDDNYESKDESESDDDGELSFDYGQSDQEYVSSKSMELDSSDVTFPQVAKADSAKENLRSIGGISFAFRRETQASSKSAPLLAELKLDHTERAMQMGSSPSYKIHSYVLPTPVEKDSRVSFKSDTDAPQTRRTSLSKSSENLWHSSPLDRNKYEKLGATNKVSEPIMINSQSVLKERNNNSKSSRLASEGGHSLPRLDPFSASDAKKVKRQAYSGPLTEKTWLNNPVFSASGPMLSTGYLQRFSGSLLRTPLPQSSSTPKFASLSSSPPFMSSSPKISELHELPRPPTNLSSTTPPSNLVAHSGPLASKGPGLSPTNRTAMSPLASTLPVPPTAFPRSYSIPTRGEVETTLHASKPVIDVSSSPSFSLPLSNIQQPTPPAS